MREVITDWSSPGSPGGLSVMYFDDTATITLIRTSLAAMWNIIDNYQGAGTTWNIRQEGRVLDPTTGTLTGSWAEGTAQTATAALAGGVVPNAAQVLLRWNTTAIVNGRAVKGRTYVPGLQAGQLTNGELLAATRTSIGSAIAAFQGAGNGFGVWHRPVTGSGGSFHLSNTGSVWSELAVQRKRRA